jgi:uncharacterized membrane protein
MRIAKKTLTYGIMHIVVAFFVALAVSRDLQIALGISLAEPFVQIFFFSIHEYLWNKHHPELPSTAKTCCTSLIDLPKSIFDIFRRKGS